MSFLRSLFGPRQPVEAHTSSRVSHLPSSQSRVPTQSGATPRDARREMLGIAFKKSVALRGIPPTWLDAEIMRATSRKGEVGMHLRIVLRHWDPTIVLCTVAFQNDLIARLMSFDPLTDSWLFGISWQFALTDESQCPPLPRAATWAQRTDAPHERSDPAPAEPAADNILIQGAQRMDPGDGDAKAQLDKLLAVLDEEYQARADARSGTQATQPMYLATEPSPLGRPRDPPD